MKQDHRRGAGKADAAVAKRAAARTPATRRRSTKVNGRPNHRLSSHVARTASPPCQEPLRRQGPVPGLASTLPVVTGLLLLMRLAATVPNTTPITTAGSARRPNTITMPAPPDAGQNTAKVQGRRNQGEPKPGCQKIRNGDGARRAECRYPPARSGCLSYQIPVNPVGCACRLQSSPENLLLEVFFLGGSYTNCAHFQEAQFVPIRSTRRQRPLAFICRGDRAACLRRRFAKEGTVIGCKPSWIGKSVLEGYVGDRHRCGIGAFKGCLDCRKAPAAQIANG